MPKTKMMEARLRFLNIGATDFTELQKAKAIIDPVMDEMLDRFYEHILAQPELKSLFSSQDSLDRARSKQKQHWQKILFDGQYGNQYYEKAAEIGGTHYRVGLTPDWYIGAYCFMLEQFIDLIARRYADSGKSKRTIIVAVTKIVLLDIDIVIQCYLDAKDASMRQILGNATDLKADIWSISDELNDIANEIRGKADAQVQASESLRKTNNSNEISSTDENDHTEALLQLAEKLQLKTQTLDERLKRIPLNQRLYVEKIEPRPGIITRIKAFFFDRP